VDCRNTPDLLEVPADKHVKLITRTSGCKILDIVNVSFGGKQRKSIQATLLLSADQEKKSVRLKAYEQMRRLKYEQTFRSGFNIPKGNYRFSSPCQMVIPTQ